MSFSACGNTPSQRNVYINRFPETISSERKDGGLDDFAISAVGAAQFYTMNMSDYSASPFKSQTLSFWQQGYEVGAVVSAVRRATGKSHVVLVGHSMGGLVLCHQTSC